MKIFGSSRSAARVEDHHTPKKRGKGWMIALISVMSLLLVLVGVAVYILCFYAEAPDPVGPTFSDETIDPDTGNVVERPTEPVEDP